MTLRSNLTELDHWLSRQGVSPNDLPPPIGQARLTELQAAFAHPFPEALLALVAWHDGLPDWLMFGGTWHLLGSELSLEIYWEDREVF
ncbi:hypothetical protein E7T06_20675 [Deinococcus sp. Arct2-2]|uniref:hypothetical protein n=1 Tax=Deinococcus sp. Arct2-2 TaxID=2568653 RepID=UPI0010A4A4A2|nr:hypothetical protein [Deinococcus sp. Arct2-2]THF66717.1 hypothetical protein E7T06_20675 [Deinococcus sp. Arct2-2]